MKTLRFPARPGPARDITGRIALLERLLAEYLSRESTLREDGRRLRVSLERLSALNRNMMRATASVRRSAARLRAGRRPIAPSAPLT